MKQQSKICKYRIASYLRGKLKQ